MSSFPARGLGFQSSCHSFRPSHRLFGSNGCIGRGSPGRRLFGQTCCEQLPQNLTKSLLPLDFPVKRETTGTVTGISHQGIAVEYGQDKKTGGREVWIPFSEKAKRSGALKDLSGLEVGDKVGAVYDEYPDMTKQLTQITLLKKKPKEKESEE